jgi:hypothetical protein
LGAGREDKLFCLLEAEGWQFENGFKRMLLCWPFLQALGCRYKQGLFLQQNDA